MVISVPWYWAVFRCCEYRSRQPVHVTALHRRVAGGWCGHLDGRPGPLDGQCVYRTAVAQLEIRMHLPARIRDRFGAARRTDVVDQLLQYPTPTFDAGRAHA